MVNQFRKWAKILIFLLIFLIANLNKLFKIKVFLRKSHYKDITWIQGYSLFLPLALAIMMTGLGLELSIKDFIRLKLQPKAIFLALFTQQIVLVGIAFLLCIFLKLPPLLAVGLMLLSASPSGPSANLISYLYQGDVALNIMLTIMNTLICLFTLPFIVNLSLYYFLGDQQSITLPTDKILQVF